ncbi:MAG TPA: response regulator, partial [Candidatus Solibacter sp.]|nr:response regulator [Candidatus Solibacter sp.]
LGLSIVYGIIKQAGGTIDVDTQLGRGTTFRICLPEVLNVELQPEAQRAPESIVRGCETVMLVEDEDALRALVAQVLRASGYTVIEAPTGEDAERACREFQGVIALLVTDVVMPGMNGPALAQQLQVSRPGMRVLYMSGHTENVFDAQHNLGPGTAFLQKPFAPSILVHQVRELLDAPP